MRRSYSVLLGTILLVAAVECCQTVEEIRMLVQASGEECVKEKEPDIAKDELESIMQGNCPTTQSAKCIMTCIAEKVGIVEGNQFSFEHFMETANKTSPCYSDIMKKAENVLRTCNSNIGTVENECDIGLKFCECISQYHQEEGKVRGRV